MGKEENKEEDENRMWRSIVGGYRQGLTSAAVLKRMLFFTSLSSLSLSQPLTFLPFSSFSLTYLNLLPPWWQASPVQSTFYTAVLSTRCCSACFCVFCVFLCAFFFFFLCQFDAKSKPLDLLHRRWRVNMRKGRMASVPRTWEPFPLPFTNTH